MDYFSTFESFLERRYGTDDPYSIWHELDTPEKNELFNRAIRNGWKEQLKMILDDKSYNINNHLLGFNIQAAAEAGADILKILLSDPRIDTSGENYDNLIASATMFNDDIVDQEARELLKAIEGMSTNERIYFLNQGRAPEEFVSMGFFEKSTSAWAKSNSKF